MVLFHRFLFLLLGMNRQTSVPCETYEKDPDFTEIDDHFSKPMAACHLRPILFAIIGQGLPIAISQYQSY